MDKLNYKPLVAQAKQATVDAGKLMSDLQGPVIVPLVKYATVNMAGLNELLRHWQKGGNTKEVSQLTTYIKACYNCDVKVIMAKGSKKAHFKIGSKKKKPVYKAVKTNWFTITAKSASATTTTTKTRGLKEAKAYGKDMVTRLATVKNYDAEALAYLKGMRAVMVKYAKEYKDPS